MQKAEIIKIIEEKHQAMIDFLASHDDEKWNMGPEGKWTAGQHIVHLIQSAKPLNKILSLPNLYIKYKFGTPNRPVRSYEEVAEKYRTKLAAAGNIVSPFSVNMPATPISGKQGIIESFTKEKNILIKKINKQSEASLDRYLIPHPLLGRMIMREFMMWSARHTEHHMEILKEKY